MYCGLMKKRLVEPSVEDLLKTFPTNHDVKVTVDGASTFYVHFDMEGNSINIDTRPWIVKYGERAENNDCRKCACYKIDKCECDPADCINYDAFFKNDEISKIEESKAEAQQETAVEEKENVDNIIKNSIKKILEKMLKSLDEE